MACLGANGMGSVRCSVLIVLQTIAHILRWLWIEVKKEKQLDVNHTQEGIGRRPWNDSYQIDQHKNAQGICVHALTHS
jgi:hypothetical protein